MESSIGNLYAQSILNNGNNAFHQNMSLPFPPSQMSVTEKRDDLGKKNRRRDRSGRNGNAKFHRGTEKETVPNSDNEYTAAMAHRARRRKLEEAAQAQHRSSTLAKMKSEEAAVAAANREGRRLLQTRRETEARMRRMAELDAQCQIEENGTRWARRLAAAEQEKREKKLLVSVQALLRGCITRRIVEKLRKKVAERKQREEEERKMNQIKKMELEQKARAAIVLQGRVRQKQTTELSRIKESQIKISIWWRWHYFCKKNKHEVRKRKAIVLQTFVRRHLAWKKYKHELNRAIRNKFSVQRMRECQRWVQIEREKSNEKEKLAVALQKQCRGHLQYKKFKAQNAARQNAAIKLQSRQRQKLGKRKASKMYQERKSAVKIQTVARKKIAKAKVGVLREKRKKRNNAAVSIQNRYRGFSQRKQYKIDCA